MAVITVSRQYGAGGSEVARRVAESLGWQLVDNEFVDQVAERAGLPPAEVAEREERAPGLLERLARTLAVSSPEVFVPGAAGAGAQLSEEAAIVRMTEAVIREAAAIGRVVLVGRGAAACLARVENVLHSYVMAPREVRIKAVMERLGLSEKEAARTMDETDAARDRYVETHYRLRRGDPTNYHLILNTGWLGADGAARIIGAAAELRGWAGRG